MSTVSVIARKEFRDTLRDGRFRSAAVAIWLLLAAAIVTGILDWRAVDAERRTATELTRSHWIGQGEANPHSAVHYGLYAFKPAQPLAALDPGLDPWTGVLTYLEGHRWNEARFRPAQDATELQRFATLSVASVLQLFAPLLIIAVAFGAFATEREQGTLRQLAALGIPPARLAAGKLLGLGAALAVILLPALLAALAALALGTDLPTATLMTRLPFFSLAYAVFLAGWLSLSVAVSARARAGHTALLALLAIWGITSFLIPRAMTSVVQNLVPTPTMEAFQAAIARDRAGGFDGRPTSAERNAALREQIRREHGLDVESRNPEALALYSALNLQAGEVHADTINDRHYQALWDRFAAQERLRQFGALLSPTIAVRSLSAAAAGTDLEEHLRFTRFTEDYRRMFVAMMNHDLAMHAPKASGNYVADSTLWQTVPPFLYSSPTLGRALESHRLAAGVLGTWLLATTLLAVTATRRMEVAS